MKCAGLVSPCLGRSHARAVWFGQSGQPCHKRKCVQRTAPRSPKSWSSLVMRRTIEQRWKLKSMRCIGNSAVRITLPQARSLALWAICRQASFQTPAPTRQPLPYQSCNEGTIGSIRTVTVLWRAIRPQTRVRAEVAYKRINCQQWRIFRIRAVLLDQPRHGVYYRALRYERIWSAAYSQYRAGSIQPGCNRLNTNWEVYNGLQTIIRAGFYAQHEVEDDEDNLRFHCEELGNSYTSARFLLTGGTS